MKTLSPSLVLILIFAAIHGADPQQPNEWEGKTIPQLVLESGKTYKTVTIVKIEADAISITHSAGMARIPMEDLQQSSRDALGYDPEKAVESRQRFLAQKASADRANDARIAAEKAELAAKEAAKDWYNSSREYYVRVTQVLDDGILGYVSPYEIPPSSRIYLYPSFVEIPTSEHDLYDGWYGIIRAVQVTGTYSYKTVLGAKKTVAKYIYVPEKR